MSYLLVVMLELNCQEYSMKYTYSTSQMSKLSLTLYTFSITGSVNGLFLTLYFVLMYLEYSLILLVVIKLMVD